MMSHCFHCDDEQDLKSAHCSDEDDSLHCPEHRIKCDGPCEEVHCRELLKEDKDTNYFLCKVCNQPEIIAAMLKTMEGDFADYNEFLEQMRRSTQDDREK